MNPFGHLASFVILSLVTAAAAGCTASSGAVPGETTETIVSAQTLASLPKGEHYVVDLTDPAASYAIDFATPIDFDRITVRVKAAADLPMTEWLADAHARGEDVLASSGQRFEMKTHGAAETSSTDTGEHRSSSAGTTATTPLDYHTPSCKIVCWLYPEPRNWVCHCEPDILNW